VLRSARFRKQAAVLAPTFPLPPIVVRTGKNAFGSNYRFNAGSRGWLEGLSSQLDTRRSAPDRLRRPSNKWETESRPLPAPANRQRR